MHPSAAMPGGAEPLRNEVRIAALLDPRPGGTFRVEANGRDVVIGEYVEVDPPHRVVFTWGFEGADPFVAPGSTRVEDSAALRERFR
jgi:uncharacterized protein YndB with AHSA1/START domain